MADDKPPVVSAMPALDGERAPRMRRVAPSPSLAAHVAHYWTLSVAPDEPPARVHALPDGCVDLVFELSTPSAPRAFVAGARTVPATYRHERGTELGGASFRPAGALAALGVGADAVPADSWAP